MTKTVLTSNLNLYANPATGLLTNDGTSSTQGSGNVGPLPEIQDCINLLYANYDLNNQFTATIHGSAATFSKGLSLSGRVQGQRTPGNLVITGAGRTSTIIKPTTSGVAGAEINYGAACTLQSMGFDMTLGQDAIITGKRADFTLNDLRFSDIAAGHNCITQTEFTSSTVTGNLWIATDCQCFCQLDQNCSAYWNTNGIPNTLAIFLEWLPTPGRYPQWGSSFLDSGEFCSISIQNIDYNGWKNGAYQGTGPQYASGPRANSRAYSIIDLNTLGVGTLPGSTNFQGTQQGVIR